MNLIEIVMNKVESKVMIIIIFKNYRIKTLHSKKISQATDPTATAAREAFYVAVQQAVDAEVAAAVAKR